MGRIRILPDQVANKIAAGEVVERPASVVKELLENALDAGASQLRIEAAAGGRRLIRVSDDGTGMGQDDALLAFERHATSKLRQVKDLLAISTLGFRGEALPSIASVSRLTLETKCDEEAAGARVEIAGGKILNVEETGLPRGTQVTVRDLFFNVPARRKFLRTEKTELAHITSLVTHYSLAHTDKAFHLSNEKGDLLKTTPVTSLQDRVYQIFGADTLAELVEFGPAERELQQAPSPVPRTQAVEAAKTGRGEPQAKTFRLHGFISRPQVQKLNRNSIFIFVNRRLIRDRLLLHAISSAYYNIIPPGTFPFALLFLDLPFDEVDANVHPSKVEVRFRHQSFVHDFVRDALREALTESKPVSAFPLPPQQRAGPQPGAALPFSENTQLAKDAQEGAGTAFELRAQAPPPARIDFGGGPPIEFPEQTRSEGLDQRAAPPPHRAAAPPQSPGVQQTAPEAPQTVAEAAPQEAVRDAAAERRPPPSGAPPVPDALHSRAPLVEETSESMADLSGLRPLGQVRDSFIVASSPQGLWLIDQHVAHERILFEQVLHRRCEGRVEAQRLLMPMIVTLKPDQQIKFAEIEQEFRANGFDIEPFGRGTIAVKAAPAALSSQETESLIREILDTPEKELRSLSLEALQRRIAATVACHAAIKVNTPLDPAKIRWLLDELAKTRYPMSCPHGRPVALQYSLKEILKAFHRI